MRHEPPIIYFAGVAQHSLGSWFAGHPVLESYANLIDKARDDGGLIVSEEGNLSRWRLTYSRACLDPGAFSNRTAALAGKPPVVTVQGYINYSLRHGEFYDFCASFDHITDGPEPNRRDWIRCKDAGVPRLMPVFHQGEPWSLLDEYCAGAEYIGLGMQRPFNDEATFLDGAFSRIPESKWVHIFAGTNYLRWPARSADSTTWLRETLALMRVSGQGRTALRFLNQQEMLGLVLKKYEREWKLDRHRGVFGVEAGRGEQIDLEDLLKEMDHAHDQ